MSNNPQEYRIRTTLIQMLTACEEDIVFRNYVYEEWVNPAFERLPMQEYLTNVIGDLG